MSAFTERSVPLLALAVAAVLAAGCGGEDRLTKAAYEQKVRTVYAGVQAAFEATRDVAPAQLAGRIETARKELRAAAEELEHAEPPKAVEEENEELVEGMRDYAESLGVLRAAAQRRDAAAIARFNAGLGSDEAVERMAEAAEEMKFKGFDLGRIAEE